MTQAIIFDCFGVLVTEAWFVFRDKYFPSGPKRQQATDLNHAANKGMLSYEAFEREVAKLAGVSLEELRSYLNKNLPNEPLLRYIETELKPKYRIGLLSNAAADWLGELFTPKQRQLFDAVALSYEMKVAKPDPRAFQIAADRLGVPPEACVFIDDSEIYCAAARELGMKAVWFKNFEQARAEIESILADTKH